MKKKSRMYEDTKTWNIQEGCDFGCKYCVPAFQETLTRMTKLSGNPCVFCMNYKPHQHRERLKKIPSAKNVFVCGDGDISFADPKYVKEIILRIKEHLKRCPHKTFYFQTKNPDYFNSLLIPPPTGVNFTLLAYLDLIKDNAVLLTTLETNRDEGYEEISKAPKPRKRFMDFLNLDYPRKIVTIEPIMDFDLEIFFGWINLIKPEAVYIGYNSRPNKVQLPEPSPEKFWDFVEKLKDITEVRLKDTRGG